MAAPSNLSDNEDDVGDILVIVDHISLVIILIVQLQNLYIYLKLFSFCFYIG